VTQRLDIKMTAKGVNNGINYHFPTYVYYCYEVLGMLEHQALLDKCEEIKNDILADADTIGWNCDLKTSWDGTSDLIKYPEFNTLIDSIRDHVFLFLQHLNANVSEIQTKDVWINSSVKGQYQETHTHQNVDISAIYYLKTPEGCGDTIFKSPYEKQNLLPISNYTDVTGTTMSYTPEAGKLLLFESHVPHLVKPNRSDAERMTLAANFTVA
jgi:uncharacterized protein (TIGR02466 family)